jgi:hypothetical protein
VRHALRSSSLLDVKASLARVFQSGLKTGVDVRRVASEVS